MDQKLNRKMINDNLLCNDITENKLSTEVGFSVQKETKFKTLKVIESSTEDVPVGSEIVVPYHSGNKYEGQVIVSKHNIIYIK